MYTEDVPVMFHVNF